MSTSRVDPGVDITQSAVSMGQFTNFVTSGLSISSSIENKHFKTKIRTSCENAISWLSSRPSDFRLPESKSDSCEISPEVSNFVSINFSDLAVVASFAFDFPAVHFV